MNDPTTAKIGTVRVLVLAFLFAWPSVNSAQDSATSGPAKQSSTQSGDLARVLAELQRLRTELSDLHAEVNQLRAQQHNSEIEAADLKKDLLAAKAQAAAAGANNAGTSPSGPDNSDAVDRVARLEENQQMADQKLVVQEQSKVESGSKYRLRLSGILL